jgi:hypothetical protein
MPPAFTLVSCLAYYSTLKMDVICSSEKSVDFQWTTWQYIPEDSTHEEMFSFLNIESIGLIPMLNYCIAVNALNLCL